jgi:hypothetical protein
MPFTAAEQRHALLEFSRMEWFRTGTAGSSGREGGFIAEAAPRLPWVLTGPDDNSPQFQLRGAGREGQSVPAGRLRRYFVRKPERKVPASASALTPSAGTTTFWPLMCRATTTQTP